MTAPAVFDFTAMSAPHRHREAAAIFLGKDGAAAVGLDRLPDEEVGKVLGDAIRAFLERVRVPRGLEAVGYHSGDISRVSLVPDGIARCRSSMSGHRGDSDQD